MLVYRSRTSSRKPSGNRTLIGDRRSTPPAELHGASACSTRRVVGSVNSPGALIEESIPSTHGEPWRHAAIWDEFQACSWGDEERIVIARNRDIWGSDLLKRNRQRGHLKIQTKGSAAPQLSRIFHLKGDARADLHATSSRRYRLKFGSDCGSQKKAEFVLTTTLSVGQDKSKSNAGQSRYCLA